MHAAILVVEVEVLAEDEGILEELVEQLHPQDKEMYDEWEVVLEGLVQGDELEELVVVLLGLVDLEHYQIFQVLLFIMQEDDEVGLVLEELVVEGLVLVIVLEMHIAMVLQIPEVGEVDLLMLPLWFEVMVALV